MIGAREPEDAFVAYEREVDLLESAARTGAPTEDVRSKFFGWPADDFRDALKVQRDRVEASTYLSIVALTEGILQRDWKERAHGKANVPLTHAARRLFATAQKRNSVVTVELILDAWREAPECTPGPVSRFKQLYKHRHFLAHGSWFTRYTPAVPVDPGYAIARYRALIAALRSVDAKFPR